MITVCSLNVGAFLTNQTRALLIIETKEETTKIWNELLIKLCERIPLFIPSINVIISLVFKSIILKVVDTYLAL